MAQASIAAIPLALGPSGSASRPAALTADELRELREYEKIVQFRDSILAGHHPRIKVQSSAKNPSNSQPVELGSALVDRHLGNIRSMNINAQQTGASPLIVGETSMSTSTSKPFGLGATQIDPLLLTKSSELIKAELQLQRQRLERSLRDQFEQHRAAKKAEAQFSEPPNAFDIPDILAKALTLVQATAPAPTANTNVAANASESSDSFDENTFYSSQHDTPEPHISPPAHNTPEDTQMRDAPFFAAQFSASTSRALPPSTLYDSRNVAPAQNLIPPAGGFGATGYAAPGQASTAPRAYRSDRSVVEQVRPRDDIHVQVNSSNGSGTTSRTGGSGMTESDHPAEHPRQLLPGIPSSFNRRSPPFVRGHNLEPVAPQPTHVSPIATVRQPPVVPDPDITILPGAPAQVSALRQETANGTSPDSSPQGDKGSKRKNKKKKRKAAEGRTAGPTSPLIKPEPRSPSPVVAPPYARPNKRQRHSNRSQQELSYEEARVHQPVGDAQEEYEVRPLHRERVPVGYLRPDEPYTPLRPTLDAGHQRYERPVYGDRQAAEPIQYVRRMPSPPSYGVRYAPGETRSIRSATYSVADPIFRDASAYHPEGRSSVRPAVDRVGSHSPAIVDARPSIMGPPLQLPSRIVRDQFGREYLEPPPPPVQPRRSAAVPAPPPVEQGMVYERAPVRATSRVPAADTFERDGIIYRRASPITVPRRVITQPDYSPVEYHSYREREYPAQPLPPISGREYVQYRGATEAHFPGDVAREYTARALSVRPPESVRYEYGGVPSVRPDRSAREYVASIHPDPRREVAPQVYREFSARPVQPAAGRPELSTRPSERYYDGQSRGEDELGYVEPPHTVQHEVVYDDGRREAYR